MEATSRSALVVENLGKQYGGAEKPALSGLDLSIRRGEIFGLLGPNGASKTTAISILSTTLQPDCGRVTLCDVDILKHPRQARRHIGLVPQDIALYPDLTAWENLSFFGRLQGLGGNLLKTRIQKALEAVGLAQRAHQRVSDYSGGMKRRANLAAGILHHPRVLFLDEPTVGVDAQSRQLILDELHKIKRTGTTIIYTTHYMEEAQQLCDRLAILDQGRILIMGTPVEVMEQHPQCGNLGDLFLKLTGKALRD
jgi:ABC-2 type transport system ATP-binding protein